MKLPDKASKPVHKVEVLRAGNNYFVKTYTIQLFYGKDPAVNFAREVAMNWGLPSKSIKIKRIGKKNG